MDMDSRPPSREVQGYLERLTIANEAKSIPCYSGRSYGIAEASQYAQRPRDVRSLSIHVPGERQLYGLQYGAMLAEAAHQATVDGTPEALKWPTPRGTRARDLEGYTGHVPRMAGAIGLTTAERVRASDRLLAEHYQSHPEERPREEPASQPHAGFPVRVPPARGLAADREAMVRAQRARAESEAARQRLATPVVVSRPPSSVERKAPNGQPGGSWAAATASAPQILAHTSTRLHFDSDSHGLAGPRVVERTVLVSSRGLFLPTATSGAAAMK